MLKITKSTSGMTALKDSDSINFCVFVVQLRAQNISELFPQPNSWRWLMQAMSSYLALLLLVSVVASQPCLGSDALTRVGGNQITGIQNKFQ